MHRSSVDVILAGSTRRKFGALLWLALTVLGGCATSHYTVDDGRPVDETLLANLRDYGRNEQAVRPAIARSGALHDAECDKQWELPFSVVSSQSWSERDRVAWVRALGVDERLTVVATTGAAPLKVGDKIADIAGFQAASAEAMSAQLIERRDQGRPFRVALSTGRQMTIEPFQVCRGYTRFAPPNAPQMQDYHWLMSLHPLQVGQVGLSEDEALWVVLWGQGLSEEGGLRMKAFDYGRKFVGTVYNLFTLATGLKGAAMAADAALKAAQNAAASAATELARTQLIDQARSLAATRLRDGLSETAQKMLNQQALGAMQQSAANRANLSGVAYVGATVFDRADSWAFERARRLDANPISAFSLHQKLLERGYAANAFLLDVDRLSALSKRAEAQGLGDAVVVALSGLQPARLEAELAGMPLASAQAGFSYDDPAGLARGQFANGLIEATLAIPMETAHGP